MTGSALVSTTFTVLRVLGGPRKHTIDLPLNPGLDALRAVLNPLLDGKNFEHVSVLNEGRAADMFVDETGACDGQVRNDAATKIYRAAELRRNPKTNPESLPAIYGTAILVDRRVWS